MNELPALSEPLASCLIEGKTRAIGIAADPFMYIEITPSEKYPEYFDVKNYEYETKPDKPINRHGLQTLIDGLEPDWRLFRWSFYDWRPDDKAKRNQTFVYFVRAGDIPLVKIGFSTGVEGRMASLQTGSPVKLVLLGYVAAKRQYERELHEKFNHLRSHGEWFRLDDELSQFIKSATKEGN